MKASLEVWNWRKLIFQSVPSLAKIGSNSSSSFFRFEGGSAIRNSESAFFWAFLAAAATTPLGVLVSGPFVYGLGEDVLGSLFALSAGLLLFVATGPLMAPLKDVAPVRGLLALTAGVVIAVLLLVAPIPGHDHGELGGGHDHDAHGHGDHD